MFELRDNQIFDPSWFRKEPKDSSSSRKLFVTSEQMKDLLSDHVDLKSLAHLTIREEVYYLTSVNDAQDIIDHTRKIYAEQFGSKTSDHDMVNFVLAQFSNDAYTEGRRRAPHCVGLMQLGNENKSIVLFTVNNDLEIRYYDPSSDSLRIFKHIDEPIDWLFI